MALVWHAIVCGTVFVGADSLFPDALPDGPDGSVARQEAPAAESWFTYGNTYSEQRFSPLARITDSNVGKLGLAWFLDLPGMKSLVSTPLMVDGKLYFTGSHAVVYSVDARDGRIAWVYDPRVMAHAGKNRRVLWDTNRGVAYLDGTVFVGTGDGRLIALDAASGSVIWSVRTFDPDSSRVITGAPRAFRDLVVIGHGGADTGPTRGYVTAYDAKTGEQRWRFYTVPGDPANGFENDAMKLAATTWTGEWWKLGGGGTVWNAITYDPEFDAIYLGTGNGSPWNRKIRSPGGGDNLFLCSIVALDANSGEYRWHYQTTPGETWDFNSAMDMVLADLEIDGTSRKLLMHAPKNGFFYVIDRATGKLVSADKLGKVTWATHVDLHTGKPVEAPDARYETGPALIWPGPFGAHNWHPMSFNPRTGLVYIPYQEAPGYYTDAGIDLVNWKGEAFTSSATGVLALEEDLPTDGTSSALIAWDPVQRRASWRVATPGIWNAGTLTTAGNLVFQGRADGRFIAYAADSGRILWDFDARLGISAPPISYELDGEQYIALLVGWGGAATTLGGSIGAQHGWRHDDEPRRLLVFALNGDQELPPIRSRAKTPPVPLPDIEPEPAQVESGKRLYANHCGFCHGAGGVSGGYTPDLRTTNLLAGTDAFRIVVTEGRPDRGMPPFPDLGPEQLDAIRAFLLHERPHALEAVNDPGSE